MMQPSGLRWGCLRYIEAYYFLATVLFDPADCFRVFTWRCQEVVGMLTDFATLGAPGPQFRLAALPLAGLTLQPASRRDSAGLKARGSHRGLMPHPNLGSLLASQGSRGLGFVCTFEEGALRVSEGCHREDLLLVCPPPDLHPRHRPMRSSFQTLLPASEKSVVLPAERPTPQANEPQRNKKRGWNRLLLLWSWSCVSGGVWDQGLGSAAPALPSFGTWI